MAYHIRKTEHSGAKKGNGAFWGYKEEAKNGSNKVRRRQIQEVSKDEAFEDLRKELDEMKIPAQGRLSLQQNGRYAIYLEFTSGDVVEVLIDGEWQRTTIESGKGQYYLTNGHPIEGAIVRTPS
jgi:hypothetical protein